MTFPTTGSPLRPPSHPRFNAREGLVTFPTRDCARVLRLRLSFQCPRGLGDFSHEWGHGLCINRKPASFNAREGLVTFPTELESSHLILSGTAKGFNAREGLVTFPTQGDIAVVLTDTLPVFQCPRGLGDFSHQGVVNPKLWPEQWGPFQCPRGLGDFSHTTTTTIAPVYYIVSMPARAW